MIWIWIELIWFVAFMVMGFIQVREFNSKKREYVWLRDHVKLPESKLEKHRFNLEFLRFSTISAFLGAAIIAGVLIGGVFQL